MTHYCSVCESRLRFIIYQLVGITLEREYLHLYTLDPVLEDKHHDKKQIYARTKDPDCAGINRNRHKHSRLCRKHNVRSQTFHGRKQRFVGSGKAGPSQSGKKNPIRITKKREDNYKRLIGELAVASDILKNLDGKRD